MDIILQNDPDQIIQFLCKIHKLGFTARYIFITAYHINVGDRHMQLYFTI